MAEFLEMMQQANLTDAGFYGNKTHGQITELEALLLLEGLTGFLLTVNGFQAF